MFAAVHACQPTDGSIERCSMHAGKSMSDKKVKNFTDRKHSYGETNSVNWSIERRSMQESVYHSLVNSDDMNRASRSIERRSTQVNACKSPGNYDNTSKASRSTERCSETPTASKHELRMLIFFLQSGASDHRHEWRSKRQAHTIYHKPRKRSPLSSAIRARPRYDKAIRRKRNRRQPRGKKEDIEDKN